MSAAILRFSTSWYYNLFLRSLTWGLRAQGVNSVVIEWRHVLRFDWIMVPVMAAASRPSNLFPRLHVVKVRKLRSFMSPLSEVLKFIFAVTFVRPCPGFLSCRNIAVRLWRLGALLLPFKTRILLALYTCKTWRMSVCRIRKSSKISWGIPLQVSKENGLQVKANVRNGLYNHVLLLLSLASVVQFWVFACSYFFGFLISLDICRTPWTSDQLVARPLPTQDNTT
jgi:hypothetical protein